VCGEDKALRARLERMLAAHEAPAGALGAEAVREVPAPRLDLPQPIAD